jgi:hypothetical protein
MAEHTKQQRTPSGAGGGHSRKTRPPTPAAVGFSSSDAQEKTPGLTTAVEGFLAGLRLTPAEQVAAGLMVELARAFDESPGYSKARLAAELRACLAELAESAEEVEPRLARVL